MASIYLDDSQTLNSVLKTLDCNQEYTLYLAPKIYYEKIELTNSNIRIIGIPNKTIISYDDYAKKIHADGFSYNTFRTPSFSVYGNNNVFKDLIFLNDAPLGNEFGQAVAVAIYGNNNIFVDCMLKSSHDTLFLGPLPNDLIIRYQNFLPSKMLSEKHSVNFFINTSIVGKTDFIFGSGEGFFYECKILSSGDGYILAPSHGPSTPYGFVLYRSLVSNTIDNKEKTLLARPWRNHGQAIFYECFIEDIIKEKRYDAWDKENFKFYEYPYIQSLYGSDLFSNKNLKAMLEITIKEHYLHFVKKNF